MSETYYSGFYGFDSAPFHITPDPSLLFATETHQQALGAIGYGVAAGKGFIVVTGEVGVGKTTVLRICLDRLQLSKTKVIYLFNPALTVAELYTAILDALDDSDAPRRGSADTLLRLQRALLAMHEAGIQVVLAVDEAQNMPERTLESLRVLSNLETSRSKLLQIILVGQPELEVMLGRYSLRQLAQRVAVRARIKRLTFRESCRYVQHRSQRAGRVGRLPLFTAPALLYIALTARGIPRTINVCCDNALINGYGYAAERVSLRIARESCHGLRFRPHFGRARALASAAVLLASICVFAGIAQQHFSTEPSRGKSPVFLWQDRPISGEADVAKFPAPLSVVAALPPSPLVSQKPIPPPVASDAEDPTSSSPAPLAAGASVEEGSIKALPAPSIDDVEAAAIKHLKPAKLQMATPVQLAVDSSNTGPTNHWDPQSARTLQWFVRWGDTVIKACRLTYGVCDVQSLHSVFAYNPQIASNGLIRQGQVIVMPERRIGSGQPN